MRSIATPAVSRRCRCCSFIFLLLQILRRRRRRRRRRTVVESVGRHTALVSAEVHGDGVLDTALRVS